MPRNDAAELSDEQLKEIEQSMLSVADGMESAKKPPPEDDKPADKPRNEKGQFQVVKDDAPDDDDEEDDESTDFIDDEPADDDGDDDDGDDEYTAMEEHVRIAMENGWSDKETFLADPKNRGKEWVDAPEFNRRQPLIERISKQSKRIKSFEKQIQALTDELAQARQSPSRQPAPSDQPVADMAELQRKRQQAIEDGDDDALDDIDEQIAAARSGGQAAKPAGEPEIEPVTRDWLKANPWFLRNEEMNKYARDYEAKILREYPDLDTEEILDQVSIEIRRKFPHKFARPQGGRPATGVSGGSRPRQQGGGKSYNDLPDEAKKECDAWVKRGVMTKEEFVKDYFNA